MASSQKRIWETAFLLTAALGQDFNKTFVEAQQQIEETYRKLSDAEPASKKMSSAFEEAARVIGASGIMEVLGTIKDKFFECVKVASDFEYAMSGVESVAGASPTEIVELTDKARELGANTIFTAQESAQAMQYMAQAGWEAEDMLEGMDGVLAAAAASGEDFSAVSSVIADTMAGFQLDASYSGRVADVMAEAAARTNTDILTMGETFKNSAALAGALGYSIEDIAVAVGLMANAGVKGSVAGTALRNVFNSLTSGVTLSGASIGEITYSGVNADGSMKQFGDVISELRGYFSQMTEAEKFTNAQNVAGLRGYNGLIAILEATDEQYNSLYADINNCAGAAQKMADVRLDNLTGDIKLFKSAVEGLSIEFGEQFNPGLRDTVQLGTGVINWLSGFIDTYPDVAKGVTVIATAVAGGLTAISAISAVAGIVKLLAGFALDPVVLAIGGAVALISGAVAVLVSYREEENALIAETEKLVEAHASLNAEYAETTAQIETQYGDYRILAERIQLLADKENKSVAEKEILLALIDELNTAVPDLNLAYDAQSDSLNMASESMDEYIRKMYAMAMAEEEIAHAKELLVQSNEYKSQLDDVNAQLNPLYAERELKADEMQGLSGLRLQQAVKEYNELSDEIAVYESQRNLIKAKMAQSGWEYNQAVLDANSYYSTASATSAVTDAEVITEASVPDVSGGEYETNITINVPGEVSDDTVGKLEDAVEEAVERAMDRYEISRTNKFRTAFAR